MSARGRWPAGQLIEYAGGEDVLGLAGEKSEQTTWEMVAAAKPDVVVVMPCGYDAERAADEARANSALLRRLGVERVVAVDAAAFFSRPGPRLVDGVELLARVLHPERVEVPPGEGAIEVELDAEAGAELGTVV